MSGDDLLHLLRTCQENNRNQEITGILLYNEGTFVQVLEGPSEAVDGLLQTIERDPRHKGILELLRGELTERQFGDWSMGLRNVTDLTPEDRAHFCGFLEMPPGQSEGGLPPHESRKLLRILQKLMV